jgi:hypothetical protein
MVQAVLAVGVGQTLVVILLAVAVQAVMLVLAVRLV